MDAMDDPKLVASLTRIETKLDHFNQTYTTHLVAHDDHETRIRLLEKKVWTIPTTATIIALLAVLLPLLLT